MPANPYIAGSPVTSPEMFFGREDVFDFIRENLTGKHRDNVLVLYGQRRTGKTSVLYHLDRHLDQLYICIYVDLQGLELKGLNGFLWELATVIVRVLQNEHRIDMALPSRDQFSVDGRNFFENEFLDQIWLAIGDRHILLMVDEAIRLEEKVQVEELENEVFDYLRHLMQHHKRLNFLFSLGSGLETMAKEYAILFNVSLYKRISFLSNTAAHNLITQPVQDHYQFDQSAIEYILEITSGHPYYIQLLCHSLFNRWQLQPKAVIQTSDVEAVLDEVLERGLAVLKHVWEESSPVEKVILSGLASASVGRHNPVSIDELSRVWKNQHGVVFPRGEVIAGAKSLVERDVIAGQENFTFSVDIQRQFVRKNRPMEWVKEEIQDTIQRWDQELLSRRRRLWWFASASLALILLFAINARNFIEWAEHNFALIPPSTLAPAPTLSPTPTLTPTPTLLYQSGLITFLQQSESGLKRLYVLNPDGTSLPLGEEEYTDIMILAISPNHEYLALAVTKGGELNYSKTYPRFVESLAEDKNLPVDLLIVPVDHSGQIQAYPYENYPEATRINAIFPSNENLLVMVLEGTEITYFIGSADGSNLQPLAISSNLFTTPTPVTPIETVMP